MLIQGYNEFEKKNLEDFYGKAIIISGDENFYIEKCIKKVCSIVDNFKDINLITYNGENITSDVIIESCETLPIMSKVKIVHVYNSNFIKKSSQDNNEGEDKKNNKKVSTFEERLSDYVKNISPTTILLISLYGDEEEKNKIVVNIKNNGIIIKLKQLRGKELQDEVQLMFKSKGKNISKSDIIYLISQTGVSLELMKNEIDKLCDYCSDYDSISRENIDLIVHKTLESNIFKMVDGMGRKDAQTAVSILDNLLFQKENHLMILGMIIRQYRLVLYTKLYLDEKLNYNSIKSKLNIRKDFILDNLIKQSRIYNIEELKKALNICLDIDNDIKSGKYQPNLALEILVVRLCV